MLSEDAKGLSQIVSHFRLLYNLCIVAFRFYLPFCGVVSFESSLIILTISLGQGNLNMLSQLPWLLGWHRSYLYMVLIYLLRLRKAIRTWTVLFSFEILLASNFDWKTGCCIRLIVVRVHDLVLTMLNILLLLHILLRPLTDIDDVIFITFITRIGNHSSCVNDLNSLPITRDLKIHGRHMYPTPNLTRICNYSIWPPDLLPIISMS
jgi:hypothetical protein